MRFRILGPLEVLSPNGWTAIGAPKWRSLLACLLVRPGQLVPTESLILELWGDAPPSTANNLVSIYVHQLKKIIGDTDRRILVYRAPGYVLHVAPGDIDMGRFESLTAQGRAAMAAGDPERAAALLGEALGLWRGERQLLADVTPTPLLEQHARRAAELWFVTAELRVEGDIACGRAADVIPELHGLVAEYPLRERLWALLVRALDVAGRRAEALEAYARAREVIAEQLGVDPGSELQQLHAGLLAADAAPRPAAPPAPRPGRPPAAAPAPAPRPALARPAREDAAGEVDAESPGTIAIGTFDEASESASETEPGAQEAQPGLPRPAQLPADIGDFTGRDEHVEQLCGLLLAGNTARSPGAVRIVVVNGAAGLGKTTLAVHAAHEVSSRFPDGQLYVDLQGASSQTASPGEVLARFLRELGVEGDKIPARDDERAALYRTTLARRRVLILLDNARDAAQVRPLLPGSSSCAVLVTTRNRAADLASTRFVDLNVLDDAEALELFSRIAGEDRAAAEPDATAEILVACAGLPLAIRICAARLAARRQWKIATLASRLRDQHRRLDELTTGDLAVRASFQVSYDAIRTVGHGADPARAFRLLGLWEGASISLQAATALLGEPAGRVADMLESLVDVNLLESPAPDWYRLHDLLKAYAVERAQEEESEADRAEAVARLLRWYLGTAEAAADMASPQRYRVPGEAAGGAGLAFGTVDDALAWYDDERANVLSATRQAAAAGLRDIAWRMPPAMFPLFGRRSNWADCVTSHRVALVSAREAGSRPGEAWVLNQLGFALARLRDQEAFGCLERALAIRRDLGDTRGEAQTAIALGEGYYRMHGPGEEALRYMGHAVDLLRPGGPTSLHAVALNNLGEIHLDRGDLGAAEKCYRQARDICREMGGGYVEGHALHNLGRVYQLLRRFDEALASYDDALRMHRASGVLSGEATTLKHLGEVHVEVGDLVKARSSLAEAMRIFEQIGDQAEAEEAAEALTSLMTA